MMIFSKPIKAHGLLLLAAILASSHVHAEYVWMKPVGCATVIDFVRANEEPRFYAGSQQMTIAQLEGMSKATKS